MSITWTKINYFGDTFIPRCGHTTVCYKKQLFIYGGNFNYPLPEPREDIIVMDLSIVIKLIRFIQFKF